MKIKKTVLIISLILLALLMLAITTVSFNSDGIFKRLDGVANYIDDLIPDRSPDASDESTIITDVESEVESGAETETKIGLTVVEDTYIGYGPIVRPNN